MKQGFDVFNKAYGVMFRNDLHDKQSVDYQIVKNMILLDASSEGFLYDEKKYIINPTIKNHELYEFSKKLKGSTVLESIQNVVCFTKNIVSNFNVPFEAMLFGGTEKEIINRGTDWCADISRVGCALLQCLNIPSRMIILANTSKAYHGHTICEAIIDHQFMMCDFTYGTYGFLDKPYAVKSLLNDNKSLINIYKKEVLSDIDLTYIVGLYDKAAFCDYDVTKNHRFLTSKPNEYYLRMMKLKHDGTWKLEENS